MPATDGVADVRGRCDDEEDDEPSTNGNVTPPGVVDRLEFDMSIGVLVLVVDVFGMFAVVVAGDAKPAAFGSGDA